MPQFHINFNLHPSRVAISLAAALLINTAAAAFFILSFKTNQTNALHKAKIYSVYLQKIKPPIGGAKNNPAPNNSDKILHNKKQFKIKSRRKKTQTIHKKHLHIIKKQKKRSVYKESRFQIQKTKLKVKKKIIKKIKHRKVAILRTKNLSTDKIKTNKKISKQANSTTKNTKNGTENLNRRQTRTKFTINNINNKKSDTLKISSSSYPTIFEWIASHKFYPLSAIYKEEEGDVILTFHIKKDGSITEIKLKKKSTKDLNSAAIKILKNSSPIPSKILSKSNISLPTKVEINIVFRLQ